MRQLETRSRRLNVNARELVALCGCILLVTAAASASYAQAGRRVQKPKDEPPVPQTTATPAPITEPTPEPEKISLLVAGTRSASMRYSLGVAENLPGLIGRRLQDSKRLQVASGGDMSRGEANKRAKNVETKTFIVWVELQGDFDIDPFNRSTRLEDLSVSYVVLEPGTGKLKDQGTVHLRSVRGGVFGGASRLPSCFPQPSNTFEYALIVAGIEASNRIIGAFDLPNPPLCS